MRKVINFFKKYILFFSLAIVMGIAAGGLHWIRKMKEEIKKIEEEIKKKYAEVKKYEREKEKAPSPELIQKLKKEKIEWEKALHTLLINFSTSRPVVPEFKLYPAIEFKEFLFSIQENLKRKAKRRKVIIPTSLGFPETGLPSSEEIKTLSLQLAIVRDLTNLLIDSGVSVINSIKIGVPQKETTLYKLLPVEVEIKGTSVEIIRALKYLENPSSYFILESISLSESEELFKANLKINAVILKSLKGKKNEGKKKGGTA